MNHYLFVFLNHINVCRIVDNSINISLFVALQKSIIERLRKEYKAYQKTVKTNATKNGVEERRFNLTNALNRARKQNM